jgi:hypothetical protein
MIFDAQFLARSKNEFDFFPEAMRVLSPTSRTMIVASWGVEDKSENSDASGRIDQTSNNCSIQSTINQQIAS